MYWTLELWGPHCLLNCLSLGPERTRRRITDRPWCRGECEGRGVCCQLTARKLGSKLNSWGSGLQHELQERLQCCGPALRLPRPSGLSCQQGRKGTVHLPPSVLRPQDREVQAHGGHSSFSGAGEEVLSPTVSWSTDDSRLFCRAKPLTDLS